MINQNTKSDETNQIDFFGRDVKSIRKKHRLSRSEMAESLNVSPVSIEKWEQSPDKPIRPKYHQKLNTFLGMGGAGALAGLVAAPVALLPSLAIFGAAGAAKLIADNNIDDAISGLEALKKLTPEERETLISLVDKMNS